MFTHKLQKKISTQISYLNVKAWVANEFQREEYFQIPPTIDLYLTLKLRTLPEMNALGMPPLQEVDLRALDSRGILTKRFQNIVYRYEIIQKDLFSPEKHMTSEERRLVEKYK